MNTPSLPDWLDRSAYPFTPRTFDTPEGRMRYLDEGTGPAVVLVHGTPTWSFLWRGLVARLSETHRVIAPDHLGFGLSDKAPDAPYAVQDHARRLAALVDALGLDTFALVVHDFGGPIGLSVALDWPDALRALVLYNTWLWSLADRPRIAKASRRLGGPLGRLLYTRLNLSPRVLLPAFYADRQALDRQTHQHYLRPFPDPASRVAPWVLARDLVGASAWFDGLWRQIDRLAHLPSCFVWGEQDSAFNLDSLERWQAALPRSTTSTFPGAGHFVQEEAPESADIVAAFLNPHLPPRL